MLQNSSLHQSASPRQFCRVPDPLHHSCRSRWIVPSAQRVARTRADRDCNVLISLEQTNSCSRCAILHNCRSPFLFARIAPKGQQLMRQRALRWLLVSWTRQGSSSHKCQRVEPLADVVRNPRTCGGCATRQLAFARAAPRVQGGVAVQSMQNNFQILWQCYFLDLCRANG